MKVSLHLISMAFTPPEAIGLDGLLFQLDVFVGCLLCGWLIFRLFKIVLSESGSSASFDVLASIKDLDGVFSHF